MIRVDIKGRYQDTLTRQKDEGEVEVITYPWATNQIQDGAIEIINERLLGMSADTNSDYASLLPIRYMALGTGTVSTKPTDQNQLDNEFERIPVATSLVEFLDENDQVVAAPNITSKFRLTVELGAGEGNATLTEFGLFGGAASNQLNSGSMFNWITHNPIPKDVNTTLTRVIEITLSIHRS